MTGRQHDVLRAIYRLGSRYGWAPTVREIVQYLDSSIGPVHAALVELTDQGLIVRVPDSARAIRITDQGHEALLEGGETPDLQTNKGKALSA